MCYIGTLNPNHKNDAITLLEQGKHVVVRRLPPAGETPLLRAPANPGVVCPRRWRSPWP